MLIAVTGASGFVGGRVAAALDARGHQVLALGRRAVAAVPAGVRYVAWDFAAQERPVLDAAAAVEGIVHCGGSVTDWGSRTSLATANVLGTRRVLAAFPAASRVVHVSTASVYDTRRSTRQLTEQAPLATRPLNAYVATKIEAERVVRESGRRAVILRPHAIYGPGDRTLLPRILRARHGGWLPLLGAGQQRVSITHVDNLVQAIELALLGPVDDGVYNVADFEPPQLRVAFETLLRRLALPTRFWHVPVGVAWPVSIALERVYLGLRVGHAPLLTPYVVSQLAGEYTLDLSRIQRDLGYEPRVNYLTGPLVEAASPVELTLGSRR